MQAQEQTTYDTLVVDVDGTLLRTDLLHESVFGLLKRNPFYIVLLPFWLLKGKANLKQQIANRVDLPAELLPYREEFVTYLRAEQAAGKQLILATASNVRYAQAIADHLGIFAHVLGSDARENLSGSRKLAHVKERLGAEKFAYAGNAAIDLKIWQAAAAAVLVDAPAALRNKAAQLCPVVKEFPGHRKYLSAMIKAMRPHQWLKNLLIFVPLILAHQASNMLALQQAVLAFFAFCFCASSVYLLNDMLDLESDRQHPTKRNRPFAAGTLPITYGVVAMFALLAVSALIATLLPPFFLGVLAIYYVATLAYSLWLKSALLVDALMLASLYTIRLLAGATAVAVEISFWLLAFSMFIFLSLAFIKRYSELLVQFTKGKQQLVGRAYQTVDMETIANFGAASGYLAVLVMALFINSARVLEQYPRPEALWIFCLLLLYWISRMWVLTRRGLMHDDPVVFTMKDMRTYWLGLIAAIAYFVAKYWPVLRPLIPEYFL